MSAQLQERSRFLVKTLALGVAEDCLAQNAVRGLWAEIIFIVKLVYGLHHFGARQARVLDLHHLVAGIINHLALLCHEAVLHGELVQFGSGIGVRHRDLYRFHIEFLREFDRVLDHLASLAGQTENKVSMDHEAKFVAVLGELPGALDSSTLLDILQYLRIARFEADDQEPAAGIFHRFQRVIVGRHARSTRPRQAERLQLRAQFNRPRFLNVESVVVKEKFFYVGPILFGFGHLPGDVVG